ncbi:hypothetical protein SAMD00019534_057370, partial [Acytostelium subglobosum LB1]|uniref:hypothetical protein n=1 Tax=Acytostelium subglobosum LB1 TaxID=1410327 RepID=UPI00064500DF
VIVAFRGTQPLDLDNWITDAHLIQVPINKSEPDIKIHSGVLGLYNELKPQLEFFVSEIQEQCPTCTNLEVTGHSLGAALATMMVYDFYPSRFNKTLYRYIYGSPRLANQAFVDAFLKRVGSNIDNVWRIVQSKDIISQLPFKKMGYAPLPHEVWLNSDGTVNHVCLGSEDEECQASLPVRLLEVRPHSYYFGINSGACERNDYPIITIGLNFNFNNQQNIVVG